MLEPHIYPICYGFCASVALPENKIQGVLSSIGVQPKSVLRKLELIQNLANAIDDEMLLSLKRELIETVKSPTIVAKKDMAKMIAIRIGRLAYAMHHRQQMLNMVEHRPYWEFKMTLLHIALYANRLTGW